MIDGFIDRLYECCETTNLAEVSRQTGVPYNTLKNYTGEANRMPSSEVLMQIARNTNVNLHWLLTGKGECFLDGGTIKKKKKSSRSIEPGENEQGGKSTAVRGAGFRIEIPAITIKISVDGDNGGADHQIIHIPVYNAGVPESEHKEGGD
jgi:hypothetical protein